MRKSDWGDVFAVVFVLAIISLLVRPSSLGPDLVSTTGSALTALVEFAVSS
jgi:hypothetical protein